MKTGIAAVLLLLCVGCASVEKKEILEVVEVTNFAKNHGGTGSVVAHDANSSLILTNAHVCEILEVGGLVIDYKGDEHKVVSYKQSRSYDLCLVRINYSLPIVAKLAIQEPMIADPITIVGHPQLLPTIITKGFVSYTMEVQIDVGTRPCTDAEKSDSKTALQCLFNNGTMPIIQNREGLLTSAQIYPGSSGSPVFDENGDIVAVVFAGSSANTFSVCMPYNAVRDFMTNEVYTLPLSVPKDTNEESKVSAENKNNIFIEL